MGAPHASPPLTNPLLRWIDHRLPLGVVGEQPADVGRRGPARQQGLGLGQVALERRHHEGAFVLGVAQLDIDLRPGDQLGVVVEAAELHVVDLPCVAERRARGRGRYAVVSDLSCIVAGFP